MGLLDSLVGSVVSQALGGSQQGGQAALIQALIGMLMNGGLGGGGAAQAGAPAGGLGGLLEQFQRSGLGDVMNSWVGTGQNLPISGDQLESVLGGDTIAQIARQFGSAIGRCAEIAGEKPEGTARLLCRIQRHIRCPREFFSINPVIRGNRNSHRCANDRALAIDLIGL